MNNNKTKKQKQLNKTRRRNRGIMYEERSEYGKKNSGH